MDQQQNDPTAPISGGTAADTLAPTVVPVGGAASPEPSGTAEKGKQVANAATDQAKDVAAEARSQIGSVTGEAVQQAKQVMSTAGTEMQNQLGDRLGTASTTARSTAGQLRALADGRIEEAGPVGDFARTAGDQLERLADRADELGVQGVVEEVSEFARRRPVAFLVGAAAAGFVVGRLARAGKEAAADDTSPTGDASSADRREVVDLTDPAMVGAGGYDPAAAPAITQGATVAPSGPAVPVGGTYGEVR